MEIIAKLNGIFVEGVQLRISGSNNSDVGKLSHSSAAGQDQGPLLLSCRASCTTEGHRLQGKLFKGKRKPLALVEAFLTEDDHTPRVRRSHLIIVDLKRRRRLATRVSKQLLKVKVDACVDQCLNTLPILCKHDQADYQLRYVFGYAMDGTEMPCYILWPVRTEDNSFWCVDAWKGDLGST